mgnify:CR=1 FL=1
MKLDWKLYDWNQIDTAVLYAILALRSEVFVVEQQCIYLDVDGKDVKANHLLGCEDDQLIAYSRLFKSGDYFDEYSFGRAVIKQTHRGFGLGDELIQQSIYALGLKKEIKISAQYHLENLYKKHGFVSQGDTYLEDGIPHIAMYRNFSNLKVNG